MKTKYYLVSYAHERGFGNIFVTVTKGELDIRKTEKQIMEDKTVKGVNLITINKISKRQWGYSNKTKLKI